MGGGRKWFAALTLAVLAKVEMKAKTDFFSKDSCHLKKQKQKTLNLFQLVRRQDERHSINHLHDFDPFLFASVSIASDRYRVFLYPTRQVKKTDMAITAGWRLQNS